MRSLRPRSRTGTLDVNGRPRRIVGRIRERHCRVHELLGQGRSLREISRDLDLDYSAVRRHARTADVDEHVRTFAGLMHDRRGQDLFCWSDQVPNSDLPSLQQFAPRLLHDQDAVVADLSST